MFKAIIAVIAITVVLLISLSVVDKIGEGNNQNSYETSHTADISEDKIEITISGEIKRPGTYLIDLGSTLGDLIEAAGGSSGNADKRAFDTAFILENQQEFYIAPLYDHSNVCASEPIDKVCINTDSKERLLEVAALSANQADGIIEYRKEKRFERIEEIKEVNGIGPATWEKAKDFITLFNT